MITAGLFRRDAVPCPAHSGLMVGAGQLSQGWATGSLGASNMVSTKPHFYPPGCHFPCCKVGDDWGT